MPPIAQKPGGASVVSPLPKLVPLPTSGDNATDSASGLFARVQAALKGKTHMSLDPRKVRPMPNQPRGRSNTSSQEYLALDGSVQAVGQIEDAIVRRIPADEKGREYELVDGEGRWQSALRAKEILDAIVIESADTAAVYLIAGIVNMARRDYSFIAKSDYIHHLNTDPQVHLTHKQIGLILRLHKGTVEKFHALQNLSLEMRSRLRLGKSGYEELNFDILIVLARLRGKDERETEMLQLKWADFALEEGIKSASELSDRMRAAGDKKPRDGSPKNAKSATPSEWQLAVRFVRGTRVQLKRLQKELEGKEIPSDPGPVSPVHEVALHLRKIKVAVDELLERFPKP